MTILRAAVWSHLADPSFRTPTTAAILGESVAGRQRAVRGTRRDISPSVLSVERSGLAIDARRNPVGPRATRGTTLRCDHVDLIPPVEPGLDGGEVIVGAAHSEREQFDADRSVTVAG